MRPEPSLHFRERYRRDEAEIERPRRRHVGFGVDLLALDVEVDLLVAEAECDPAGAERLPGHAEHPRVEIDARIEVASGQNDVVEVIDHGSLARESRVRG